MHKRSFAAAAGGKRTRPCSQAGSDKRSSFGASEPDCQTHGILSIHCLDDLETS